MFFSKYGLGPFSRFSKVRKELEGNQQDNRLGDVELLKCKSPGSVRDL